MLRFDGFALSQVVEGLLSTEKAPVRFTEWVASHFSQRHLTGGPAADDCSVVNLDVYRPGMLN